eukprot:NODE_5148_length_424_cov_173.802667_g4475_i0.p2 GENE.NODE_5148_length_424_cov_173.802667_g4475_i0~~NODE_5148_length_424_cov_173.802667_g4475_i0.p2  ORF type:complete len:78 (-),score=2.85 NODE_5148_length_424_cov_173.802667_g4475_i0:26-259(-)
MLKPFVYSEAIFYPPCIANGTMLTLLKSYTRLSCGFGIAFTMNPMISFLIYYNGFNYGSVKGDVQRDGWLNINIDLF